MKTSTSIHNNYKCPKCNGEICKDKAGLGYSRHKDRKNGKLCDFEKGERDEKKKEKEKENDKENNKDGK